MLLNVRLFAKLDTNMDAFSVSHKKNVTTLEIGTWAPAEAVWLLPVASIHPPHINKRRAALLSLAHPTKRRLCRALLDLLSFGRSRGSRSDTRAVPSNRENTMILGCRRRKNNISKYSRRVLRDPPGGPCGPRTRWKRVFRCRIFSWGRFAMVCNMPCGWRQASEDPASWKIIKIFEK